jgi:hypothetical protein
MGDLVQIQPPRTCSPPAGTRACAVDRSEKKSGSTRRKDLALASAANGWATANCWLDWGLSVSHQLDGRLKTSCLMPRFQRCCRFSRHKQERLGRENRKATEKGSASRHWAGLCSPVFYERPGLDRKRWRVTVWPSILLWPSKKILFYYERPSRFYISLGVSVRCCGQ